MKAVITTGGKQYLVAKDDVLEVDLLHSDKKNPQLRTTFSYK